MLCRLSQKLKISMGPLLLERKSSTPKAKGRTGVGDSTTKKKDESKHKSTKKKDESKPKSPARNK